MTSEKQIKQLKEHIIFDIDVIMEGKWDDKSKVWTTKAGKPAITYYDLDQNNYRRAIGSFKINYV